MENIVQGNANDIRKSSWFLGHFMDPPLKDNDVEIKWAHHSKGEKKQKPGTNLKAKTISILAKGKFLVSFPEENREVLLEKEGDFVLVSPKIKHTWEALEDTLLISVRWPSIPGDQI